MNREVYGDVTVVLEFENMDNSFADKNISALYLGKNEGILGNN